jgi:hypothetical protein
MGDLIHSLGQSTLLLEVPVLVYRRCKGGKTVAQQVQRRCHRRQAYAMPGVRWYRLRRRGYGQKARYLVFPQLCCSGRF